MAKSEHSGFSLIDDAASPSAAGELQRNGPALEFHNGTGPANIARIATGSYTGDGTIAQAITGLGFRPKYLKIWPQSAATGVATTVFETTDTIVDDHANGVTIIHMPVGGNYAHMIYHDRIISLDADGFTVDDAGSDYDPNKNGSVYNYLAMG